MRIFVTGGTGFIGRCVVETLKARGDSLLLLSRQSLDGVESVRGDLSDINDWRGEVERFEPEATVHLAWEGIPDYGPGTSVKNLIYGLNLLTMLSEVGCKTVMSTGSCWEYGPRHGKVNEDAVINPYNAFTAAKNSLHWTGREIAREHGMNFIWTRLFYVYGPGQKKSSLIPYIIESIKNGKTPELKTPAAKNDFVYVGDVASAVAAILNNPAEYGVYNIGSGYSTGVRQIVDTVCENLGFTPAASGNPEGGSDIDFWADVSRITKDTGWKPETGISEGIKKTLDYFLGIGD